MAKTFKFGENGKWATKTGSSLAYNDQNDNFKPMPFSVTRDGIATRVNKEGLIEVVGHDKLRIDYKDSTKGVALLEPARTNIITYSEDFSNAAWSKSNSTITNDNAISPDGTLNADKLVENNSNSTHFCSGVFVGVDIETYSFSVFAKKLSGDRYLQLSMGNNISGSIAAKFDLDNGVMVYGTTLFGSGYSVGDAKIEQYPNGWYKCSISGNKTNLAGNNYTNIQLHSNASVLETNTYTGNGTSGVLLWGAQLEAGSYATSYIPTSGAAVPRAADVANGAGNAQVFNDSEGVLFANMFIEDNIEDNVNISVSGGVHEENTFKFIYLSSTNDFRVELNRSSISETTVDYSNLSLGQYNKIASSFNASTLKLYVNGFEINSTPTNALPSGLNQMNFDRADGVAPFYGKAKEIGVYDAVLTDAELEALTSYTSFTNMANELNLTIK